MNKVHNKQELFPHNFLIFTHSWSEIKCYSFVVPIVYAIVNGIHYKKIDI